MSQYYYTAASLPMLFYEEDAPVSRSVFLETCGIELAEEDCRLIQKTDLNDTESSEPTCAVLEEWRAWEKTLRNKLASLRAQRKGEDAENHIREGEDVSAWSGPPTRRSAMIRPLRARIFSTVRGGLFSTSLKRFIISTWKDSLFIF